MTIENKVLKNKYSNEGRPVITVYSTDMCGPCTWGQAKTIDPDTWN